VGRFKAEVLATRLCRLFDRAVSYSVQEFAANEYYHNHLSDVGVIVGCVDNPLARAAIAKAMTTGIWWIDAGNSDVWGQVLIGNAASKDEMRHAFGPETETCWALPLPTIQRPELLLPAPEPVPTSPQQGEVLDCAQEIIRGGQSATINQAMAALVLEVVRRLLLGTCPWMALYLDLDKGELKPVYATPAEAARVMGLRTNQVVDRRREVTP
jgi:hypothetical protein